MPVAVSWQLVAMPVAVAVPVVEEPAVASNAAAKHSVAVPHAEPSAAAVSEWPCWPAVFFVQTVLVSTLNPVLAAQRVGDGDPMILE